MAAAPAPRRAILNLPRRPTSGPPHGGHRCLGPERARRLEAEGRLRSARHAALLEAQYAATTAVATADTVWGRAHERWLRWAYAVLEQQDEREVASLRRARWLRGLCVGLAAPPADTCDRDVGSARAGCREGRWRRVRALLDVFGLRRLLDWLRTASPPNDGGEGPWPAWATLEDLDVSRCAALAATHGPEFGPRCEAVARRDPTACRRVPLRAPAPTAVVCLEPTPRGPRVAVALRAPASSVCWVRLRLGAGGSEVTQGAVAYTPAGPRSAMSVMTDTTPARWAGLTQGVAARAEALCVPWTPWAGLGGLR